MNKEEIKQLVMLLQKLENIVGTEKLERLFNWTIGTFYKLYDREEERDVMVDDIYEYMGGGMTYIDTEAERDQKCEKE